MLKERDSKRPAPVVGSSGGRRSRHLATWATLATMVAAVVFDGGCAGPGLPTRPESAPAEPAATRPAPATARITWPGDRVSDPADNEPLPYGDLRNLDDLRGLEGHREV